MGSFREFGSAPFSKSPCCAHELWHCKLQEIKEKQIERELRELRESWERLWVFCRATTLQLDPQKVGLEGKNLSYEAEKC